MTLRRYLLIKALQTGAGVLLANEAVASTCMAHPEWNLDEVRTFDEWENAQ